MPPPNGHNTDRPTGVTTWLVIPYYQGDVGRKGIERPVPDGKGASWLCPSIIVDGQPGGTAFRRGVPISVEVEVANWGAGVLPAATLLRLWWSDPTLVFSTATEFARTTIAVSPTGVPLRTGSFRVTIPTGASPHICLLAQVSAPLDGASGVPNPYEDRHWAQLNLVEISDAAADGTFVLPVVLGNPHAFVVRSTLTLSPMSREDANLLSTTRGFDIRTDGAAELEGEGAQIIDLPPESERNSAISVRIANAPVGAAPQGYVLRQQLSQAGSGEEPILTGTLGLLIGPA